MQKQIDLLREEIQTGFGEIKKMLEEMDKRMREVEKNEAACLPMIKSEIESIHKRLDDHETRLNTKSVQIVDVNNAIAKLMTMYRMVSWVAIGFGGSIIVLIWGLITGSAEVSFR